MREIKFREWNSHWKKMYSSFTLVNAITAGGISDRYNKDSVFMQYANLNDKNAKEAYSDDIVTDGINPPFVVDIWNWLLMVRLREIEFEIIGNIYENPELIN